MPHALNPVVIPFQFDSIDVRTATDDNEVLFCAKDVCAVLDITWNGSTLENMPFNWLTMRKLRTVTGEKDTTMINEAGLYRLIFRSTKPKAIEFATWVCEVVLPSIRKNGHFGTVSVKDRLAVMKQIDQLTKQAVGCKNAFQLRTTLDQLRELHNLIGSAMPALAMLNQDVEQGDLFIAGGAE